MTSIITAVLAFIVISVILWNFLMPQARVQSRAMDEAHLNRKPYRWEDEIMPDDVPIFVKLLSSWLLIGIAIPAAGWGIFWAMYKSGWLVRQDVIPIFWLPHLVCAVIVLIGFLAFLKSESISEPKLRGQPFWKQCLLVARFEGKRKALGVIWIAGYTALRFEMGWVFIGGPIYFGVLK